MKDFVLGEKLPAVELNEIVRTTGVYAVDAGGDDTYVLAGVLPAPTSYDDGDEYTFKPTTANTGACTLNVNGLGAKAIKKYTVAGKVDLETGDILADQQCRVKYDGTHFVLMSRLPSDAKTLAGMPYQLAFSGNAPTAYADLDLSGIVGANSAVVLLAVGNNNQGDGLARSFNFIRKGDATSSSGLIRSASSLDYEAGAAGVGVLYVLVPTDSAGVIQWCMTQVQTGKSVTITVAAFWKL